MAVPFTAALAATTAATGGWNAATNFFGNPITRRLGYGSNALQPNAIPAFPDLVGVLNQGLVDPNIIANLSRYSGVTMKAVGTDKFIYLYNGNTLDIGQNAAASGATIWDAITWAGYKVPPPDAAISMWRRGLISDNVLDWWLTRNGFANGEVNKTIVESTGYIPTPQELIRMAVREVFNPGLRASLNLDAELTDNPDFLDWAAAQGLTEVAIVTDTGQTKVRNFAADFWAAHWQLPSPGQLYQMFHRFRVGRSAKYSVGGIDPGPFTVTDLQNALKANDFAPVWRNKLAGIAYRIPTRVDIRRMLGVGIIDRGEVNQLYQDQGYNPADAESLTRLAEKIGPWKPTLAKLLKWKLVGRINQQQFDAGMDVYGVPGNYRQILLDDARADVPMATLQRWRRKNILDDAGFRDRAAEFTYEDRDIDLYLREAKLQPWTQYTQLTRAQIAIAVKVGIMAPDDATQRLVQLGLSQQEATAAITVIQLEVSNDFVKKNVASIRKSYLRGETNLDQAGNNLRMIGITNDRIQQYLVDWQVDLTASRRELSANQVIQALARGLISVALATQRLRNLNYSDEAIGVYLAMGVQNAQKAAALAAAKAARNSAAAQKAAEALVRRQIADRNSARRELASHGTPLKLKSWLKEGLIGEPEARARLQYLGWPNPDIDRLIADCSGEKCSPPPASG